MHSNLVSVSGAGTVFASMPSFATTNACIPLSDTVTTGPLHALKEATLGEVFWRKSDVEVSLIRGCEASMLNLWSETTDLMLCDWEDQR